MAAPRLARSLMQLRDQINGNFPGRSKVSDGWIGDTKHSARKSDHNPDKSGVVHALDITHDPAHGLDSEQVAQALLNSRDSRISYVISNGKIASGAAGEKPWQWRPYKGKNPHNHHFHLSVVGDSAADSADLWHVGPHAVAPVAARNPTPAPKPGRMLLVMGTKGDQVEELQELLNKRGAKLVADADFGPATKRAVIAFQRKAKLVPDGKAGLATWAALAA